MDNVLNIEKCKICGGLVSIENSSDGLTKICTCCGYFYKKENPKNEVRCHCGDCNKEENDSVDVKEIEYLNPCGAYKLVTFSRIGQVGTLGENVSEEEVLKRFNFTDSVDVKEIEYLNPCGAYKLVTFSRIGQVGTLGENVSEEEVLKRFNFTDTSRLNLNKTYINYRNTETNEFKVIFGNGNPESYDEFVGKVKH